MTETAIEEPMISGRRVTGTVVLPETGVIEDMPPYFRSHSREGTSAEERTFFAGPERVSIEDSPYVTLIVANDDPRSDQMWALGTEHRGWNIRREQVTYLPFTLKNEVESAFTNETESLKERVLRLEERVRQAEAEQAETERLRGEAVAQRDEARRARDEAWAYHEADITRIGDRLIDEAESRDWCGEYDTIVSDLNRDLHRPLRERTREYEVTLDVTYRVTVTVEATSEDQAAERAEEDGEWEISTYDTPETVEVYNTREN